MKEFVSGKHFIVDICNISFENANNEKKLSKLLHKMASIVKVNVLGEALHKFEPQGFTMILLLSESHLSIHTYPEKGYIAMDLYTCSDGDNAVKAIQYAINKLNCSKFQIREMLRGTE